MLGGSDAIHLSEKSLAVVLGVIVDVLINVSRYRLQLRVQGKAPHRLPLYELHPYRPMHSKASCFRASRRAG